MLSQALRGAKASQPDGFGSVGPTRPSVGPRLGLGAFSSVAQPQPSPTAAAYVQEVCRSVGSELCEADLMFGSPRPRAAAAAQPVAVPQRLRLQPEQLMAPNSVDSQGSVLLEDVFGEGFEKEPETMDTSACSTTTCSALHTPAGAQLLSTTLSTPAALSSGFTIGRAAMGPRNSSGTGLSVEDGEQYTPSCSRGGSRPIGIAVPARRDGFAPSTYHVPLACAEGFVPPHELAAASYQADPTAMHSHRHKSTAERLKAAVFEQSGILSHQTADSFLRTPKPILRAAV